MVRGVAAGATTAYAIGDVPDPGVQDCGCPLYHEVQLNAPVTRQKPTSLGVISYPKISLSNIPGCTGGDSNYGIVLAIDPQLIEVQEDRKPKVTRLLLNFLLRSVLDPQTRQRSTSKRGWVSEGRVP
jgi:hypothetical protein